MKVMISLQVVNHVMKVVKNDEKRYILHSFDIRGIGTLTTQKISTALQISKCSRDTHVIEVKMADKAVSLIAEGHFTEK